MTAFSALTPTQQALISTFVTQFLRPNIVTFAQTASTLFAMDSAWQNTILAIVTGLDAASAISDTTGLSGATPLVREDLLSVMTSIESFLTTYHSAASKTTYTKFGGINAAVLA